MSGLTRGAHGTLGTVAELVEREVLEARFAAAGGFLQRRDPLAVLGAAAALLLAAALAHRPAALAAVLAVAAAAAVASRVPPWHFVLRTFLLGPAVAILVAAPAALDVVTPGPAMATFRLAEAPFQLGPLTVPARVSVTSTGLLAAGRLVLRVAASVGIAVAVVLTVPWHRMLAAAARLGMPPGAVLALAMTHRYLHLLARLVRETTLARLSRTVSPRGPGRAGLWAQGAWLLRRSLAAAEEVESALISRGWAGRAPLGAGGRLGAADLALLGGAWLLAAALAWAGRTA